MSILYSTCLLVILLYVAYASGASISCSFDSGFCGWYRVGNSSFQWRNHSGASPDRTSGPLNDHTCKNFNGQYLYISGDDARSRDDEAVLKSSTMTLTSPSKLEFWYLMNGIGVGELTLIQTLSQNEQHKLWNRSGRKSRMWEKASIKLQPGNFTLVFKATAKLPFGGDLAIDDIRLMAESYVADLYYCDRTTTSSTTTTTTTTTRPTSTHKPTTRKPTSHKPAISIATAPLCTTTEADSEKLPGSCDFENDTCGFKVTTDHAYLSWIRTQTKIGYGDRQIPGGHSGHGYYMRYDKGRGFMWSNPQHNVRLESPLINQTDVCLSFWYIMPYEQYSNLRVFVKSADGNLTQIWVLEHFKEKHTNKWHLATMHIQEKTPYQILFSTHYNNGIARVGIDDISVLGNPQFNETGTMISSNDHPTTVTNEPTTTTNEPITTANEPTTTTNEPITTTNEPTTTTNEPTTTTNEPTTTTNEPITTTNEPITTPNTYKITTNKPEMTTNTIGRSTVNNHFSEPSTTISVKYRNITTSERPGSVNVTNTIAPVSKRPKPMDNHGSEKESTVAIVGASVGCVLSVLFIVIIGYFIYKSKTRLKPGLRYEHKDNSYDRNLKTISGSVNGHKPNGNTTNVRNGHVGNGTTTSIENEQVPNCTSPNGHLINEQCVTRL